MNKFFTASHPFITTARAQDYTPTTAGEFVVLEFQDGVELASFPSNHPEDVDFIRREGSRIKVVNSFHAFQAVMNKETMTFHTSVGTIPLSTETFDLDTGCAIQAFSSLFYNISKAAIVSKDTIRDFLYSDRSAVKFSDKELLYGYSVHSAPKCVKFPYLILNLYIQLNSRKYSLQLQLEHKLVEVFLDLYRDIKSTAKCSDGLSEIEVRMQD